MEIDKLIKLFCLASGLQVNGSKNTILHKEQLDVDLIPYNSLFPFTFFELSTGFKYLRYYLTTGLQRVEDWSWMLKKVEKKIGLWCYRWLSLGG